MISTRTCYKPRYMLKKFVQCVTRSQTAFFQYTLPQCAANKTALLFGSQTKPWLTLAITAVHL